MAGKNDPSNPSSNHVAMAPYWKMIAAISAGVRGMRAGGEEYLPKFEAESSEAYKKRLNTARMTNVFVDIVENLSMRPFDQPVLLSEETIEQFKEFAEDVDARETDLTGFAAQLFRHALEDGLTWVLVDYTEDVPENATVAEELEIGARPFWVEYRAADVLAVYSDRVDGNERFLEVRLRERTIERDGFEEKTVERVRIFRHEPGQQPEWELWRKKESAVAPKGQNVPGQEWEREKGPTPLTIDVIPLVPVVFGQRNGGGWMIDPPLRDAAYLQIELYQQENGLKNARNLTAFPVLAAKNLNPEQGDDGNPKPIVIGPSSVLYGGEGQDGGGSWEYIEPGATSLNFLREDVKDTIREMRELGRQPLTAQSGTMTVIGTAAVTQKNTSAIQAWAGMLGQSLENAFAMTAKWLNIDDAVVGVVVHDDFDLSFGDNASFKEVREMGPTDDPIISREAVLEEAKRRGILGSKYDPEDDLEFLDRRVEDPPPMPSA